MKNKLIDLMNKYKNFWSPRELEKKLDKIILAEECGLTFVGFKNKVAEYIGNNKAWSLFNDGGK